MFWSRKRKLARGDLNNAAWEESRRKSKAQLLAEASDNLVRMRMCAEWQDAARDAWYEGERQEIIRVLSSKDLRYEYMGVRERSMVGAQLWSSNPRNKMLAGAEQMYARWVSSYSALAKADGLIP